MLTYFLKWEMRPIRLSKYKIIALSASYVKLCN